MRPIELVEILGAFIAIFATVLAILTEVKVKKVLRKAQDIANSLSTRYVGYFPDNMEEVIKLIAATKRQLIIICDVPAYGHFSNPYGFAEYDQAIRKLLIPSAKPKITLITYSKDRRFCNSKNQFSKSYDDIINSPALKNYLDYHKNNKNVKLPSENTSEAFYKWLGETHTNYLADLARIGVNVYESSTDLRSFGWISDDAAIFSFYNYGNDLREVSFKTNDLPFINILKEISENSKSNSVEYVLKPDLSFSS